MRRALQRAWLVLWLLVAYTLVSVGCGGVRGPGEPQATDVVSLHCLPRMAWPGTPYQVRLVVQRPVELWCPRVTYTWPDGARSVRESDCEPEEEVGPDEGPGITVRPPHEDFRPDPIWRARMAGERTIEARLKQGRASYLVTCQVTGIWSE